MDFERPGLPLRCNRCWMTADFTFWERPLIEEALTLYRRHAGNFPDRLLGVIAKQEGRDDVLHTFDKRVWGGLRAASRS